MTHYVDELDGRKAALLWHKTVLGTKLISLLTKCRRAGLGAQVMRIESAGTCVLLSQPRGSVLTLEYRLAETGPRTVATQASDPMRYYYGALIGSPFF